MKDLGNQSPTQEVYVNNRDIEWRKKKLEHMRQEIESGQLNAFRELLSNEVVQAICEDCGYYFRTRLLTPLATIFHMIGAAVSRDNSFQSAWHLAGQSGKSGSLAKARKRLPLGVWQVLHQWTIGQIDLENSSESLWRGHRMIGVDGTCISMSETPELVERFGRCHVRHGYSRFPVARLLVAFNLKTLVILNHEVGGYTASENGLLTPMLGQLKCGDILVADRHFAGANLYAEYLASGIGFITRAHHQLRVERLEIIQVLGKGDLLVKLPINAQHRKRNPLLPEGVRIRLIETTARIRGRRETFWLATSLLDPKRYPAHEIQDWYKKRWKIETLIEELKIWLGADVLRSQTAEGVLKELYARMIALNLIHWLILKAAGKHNKKIERLSVSATLRLAASYSLKMSTAPAWQIPVLYETLLERIASSTVPYRPNRIEPRMIKRETKHYDMLKISRAEWRSLHAMAA